MDKKRSKMALKQTWKMVQKQKITKKWNLESFKKVWGLCKIATSVLKKLPFWIQKVTRIQKSVKLYFCACKCDLKGEIESNEFNEFVENQNGKAFETSAKTGQNVNELFATIVKDYLEDPVNSITSFDLVENNKSCCKLAWNFFLFTNILMSQRLSFRKVFLRNHKTYSRKSADCWVAKNWTKQ